MSSGAITITPGKQFDEVNGEIIDLAKLNALGRPTARVGEGAITRRELQSAIIVQIDDATAGLAEEITVRADADTAIVGTITTLTATVGENTAAITAEASARADADTAIVGTITTLTATVGENTTAITTEASARADADTAIVGTITTLTATVDDNTAAITVVSDAVATVDGKVTASYTLTATAGDVITGMRLISEDGTTPKSEIVFDAGSVKFRSSSTNYDPLLEGGAAADVNAGETTISGGKITAHSITASRLTLADTSNMVPDPDVVDTASWSSATHFSRQTAEADAGPSTGQIQISPSEDDRTVYSAPILVEEGKSYAVAAWLEVFNAGDGHAQLHVAWYSDAAGSTELSETSVYAGSSSTTPTRRAGTVVAPSGARRARLAFRKTGGSRGARMSAPSFRRMGDAELIVDGTITTDKLNFTLGALATEDDYAYADLTGTKPPSNADVTLTAINGGLSITGGGLTLSSGASIEAGYTAGSAGWAIKGDGSVEFNNGTFRGDLEVGSGANRTVITSSGTTIGDTTGRHIKLAQGDLGSTSLDACLGASLYARLEAQSVVGSHAGSLSLTSNFGRDALLTAGGLTLSGGGGISLDTGGLTIGGTISKPAASDSWTPALADGDGNTLAFRWNGSALQVKVDNDIFTITTTHIP